MATKRTTRRATKQTTGRDMSSLCPLTSDSGKRAEADALAASVKDQLPAGLSQPALRAFARAGLATLADFTRVTERDVRRLHGVGPKAIVILRAALKQQGQAFR